MTKPAGSSLPEGAAVPAEGRKVKPNKRRRRQAREIRLEVQQTAAVPSPPLGRTDAASTPAETTDFFAYVEHPAGPASERTSGASDGGPPDAAGARAPGTVVATPARAEDTNDVGEPLPKLYPYGPLEVRRRGPAGPDARPPPLAVPQVMRISARLRNNPIEGLVQEVMYLHREHSTPVQMSHQERLTQETLDIQQSLLALRFSKEAVMEEKRRSIALRREERLKELAQAVPATKGGKELAQAVPATKGEGNDKGKPAQAVPTSKGGGSDKGKPGVEETRGGNALRGDQACPETGDEPRTQGKPKAKTGPDKGDNGPKDKTSPKRDGR